MKTTSGLCKVTFPPEKYNMTKTIIVNDILITIFVCISGEAALTIRFLKSTDLSNKLLK